MRVIFGQSLKLHNVWWNFQIIEVSSKLSSQKRKLLLIFRDFEFIYNKKLHRNLHIYDYVCSAIIFIAVQVNLLIKQELFNLLEIFPASAESIFTFILRPILPTLIAMANQH